MSRMSESFRPPGWYRGPEGKRWWTGQDWVQTEPERTVSGLAVASMVVGILSLFIAVNALFKARFLINWIDVLGPIVLGTLAFGLGIAAKNSIGLRLAGFLTGGFSILIGILIIANI